MTKKETGQGRHTHKLETAERGTCQDTERNWPSEAHSPTGDSRGRDMSGHRQKPAKQGVLTNWRRQREGLVRKQKEISQTRHTHSLETAEGGTCQDTERHWPSEAHPHSGDGRGGDLSGHRKKLAKQGTLTPWRRQREGLVRSQEEIGQVRHTHFLETAAEETCQDRERNWPSGAHSQTGDGRGRDLSGHRKKSTERGTLTSWRQ